MGGTKSKEVLANKENWAVGEITNEDMKERKKVLSAESPSYTVIERLV